MNNGFKSRIRGACDNRLVRRKEFVTGQVHKITRGGHIDTCPPNARSKGHRKELKELAIQKHSNMGILEIPIELALAIGEYLPIKDLSSLRKTCRRLSSALLEYHYKLGLQDVGKMTALQWAAKRGYTSLAKQAILSGTDIDKPCEEISNQTPLHLAASGNHHDVIRLLLEHRATVSARDKFEMTPLHCAAECSGAEGVVLLLEKDAEVMCRSVWGDTPGYCAAKGGGVACMEALVAAGYDVKVTGPFSCTILHAAIGNSGEMVEYLLGLEEVKNAINVQDYNKATPLHLAGKVRHVFSLLSNGADMALKNAKGDTPAHSRWCLLDVACTRAFIDAGFDLNTGGRRGNTILHRAVFYRAKETVEYLLQEGGGTAIINTQNSRGLTPLDVTRKQSINRKEITKVLRKYGAQLGVKDWSGNRHANRAGEKRCDETDPEHESGSEDESGWEGEIRSEADSDSSYWADELNSDRGYYDSTSGYGSSSEGESPSDNESGSEGEIASENETDSEESALDE